eukprot:2383258-Rhodomonas_salina.1
MDHRRSDLLMHRFSAGGGRLDCLGFRRRRGSGAVCRWQRRRSLCVWIMDVLPMDRGRKAKEGCKRGEPVLGKESMLPTGR